MESSGDKAWLIFYIFLSLTGLCLCACVCGKMCKKKTEKQRGETVGEREGVYSKSGYLQWIFNLAYQLISLLIDSCPGCRCRVIKSLRVRYGLFFFMPWCACWLVISWSEFSTRVVEILAVWGILILRSGKITPGKDLEANEPKCQSCTLAFCC